MPNTNRRQFLKASAVLGTSMVAAPAIAEDSRSPNDQIRVALLGLGGRMRAHVASLVEMASDNIKIVKAPGITAKDDHRAGRPHAHIAPAESFQLPPDLCGQRRPSSLAADGAGHLFHRSECSLEAGVREAVAGDAGAA